MPDMTWTFETTFSGRLEALYQTVSAFQLFPVNFRRRADRRRTAGRRHLRRCGAQCRRIYPYVGGAARCGVGGTGAGLRYHLAHPRASPATSRSWLPWPWARSWVSGWIPTGWASRPCCSAAGSKPRVPGAAHSPARYGRACGSFPGLSAQSVCRSGTGRNVKCRNTNILASYLYV